MIILPSSATAVHRRFLRS